MAPSIPRMMTAVIFDPRAELGLGVASVPTPTPGEGQVLVKVGCASINLGEVNYLARNLEPGSLVGWDSSGVVVAGHSDAAPVGSRLASFGAPGAWAEYRIADLANSALIPADVSMAQAAAIPTVGVTALRAVEELGPIAGKSVLVTGASGGVGTICVQLAALRGAEVTALASDPTRHAELAQLGATHVIAALSECGPIDAVLDMVGGQLLADAFSLLNENGVALSIGKASGESTTIDWEAERLRAPRRQIRPFVIGADLAHDLATLLGRLAEGTLALPVEEIGGLADIHRAVAALKGRKISGKAVLAIAPEL